MDPIPHTGVHQSHPFIWDLAPHWFEHGLGVPPAVWSFERVLSAVEHEYAGQAAEMCEERLIEDHVHVGDAFQVHRRR